MLTFAALTLQHHLSLSTSYNLIPTSSCLVWLKLWALVSISPKGIPLLVAIWIRNELQWWSIWVDQKGWPLWLALQPLSFSKLAYWLCNTIWSLSGSYWLMIWLCVIKLTCGLLSVFLLNGYSNEISLFVVGSLPTLHLVSPPKGISDFQSSLVLSSSGSLCVLVLSSRKIQVFKLLSVLSSGWLQLWSQAWISKQFQIFGTLLWTLKLLGALWFQAYKFDFRFLTLSISVLSS